MKYIIAFALTGLLWSCSGKPETTAAKEPAAEPSVVKLTAEQLNQAGIEMGQVVTRSLSAELKVNGVVDVPPQNIVTVSFPMGGYLKSTQLLPGMHVSKGEVIAIMEDQGLIQLQQDYLMAEAKRVFLEKEFLRQQELSENKVNAEKTFQQVQADFTAQKIMVKGFAEKLRLIGIDPSRLSEQSVSRSVAVYSPINGFVKKVNVNIGKFVNPTDELFELINPDDIHAALTVFEKDINKVRIGQKVKVSFADDPSKEYLCEIILISHNVDENRSGTLHCHFESRPGQLLPGMFLNARIQLKNTAVQAVPEAAVVRSGNNEYLVEAKGKDEFVLLPVETGVRENGFVEVKSAQSLEGRNFVLKNAYAVLGKMKNAAE